MTTNQTIDGVSRDACQWTDLQILDFLGVALRNVDLVGTVKLSEIRQGFEYMRAQSGAEQPAPVAPLLAEAREWLGDGKNSDGLAREHWTPEYAALIDRIDATLRK